MSPGTQRVNLGTFSLPAVVTWKTSLLRVDGATQSQEAWAGTGLGAGRARLQEMGRGGGGEQTRQGGRLGEPEPWKVTRDLSADAMGGGLVLCSLEGHPKLLLPWRAENGNRVSCESLFQDSTSGCSVCKPMPPHRHLHEGTHSHPNLPWLGGGLTVKSQIFIMHPSADRLRGCEVCLSAKLSHGCRWSQLGMTHS